MTAFDTIAIVDWSGGNDTGPRPKRDAIWIGVASGDGVETRYMRNRRVAEAALAGLIVDHLADRRRLMIGFDFPFGYPAGFARALTGGDDPLAIWDWLEARIEDAPTANNRFDIAGRINAAFPGVGPFWFNGLKRDIADLPRKDTRRDHGCAERRAAETRASGAFSCWQLGGAGSVGSQVLTGLPVLSRLRRRFAGQVRAWPFEAPDAPVLVTEVWPSLLADVVKAEMRDGDIRDAVQVRVLARALRGLSPGTLAAMLAVEAPEEGWILGLGHEEALRAAARLDPPPLRNDCFALPAGIDWTPVDIALARLRDGLRCVVGPEAAPLNAAAGRILAAPVVARRANPPEANTAVDGYGFAASTIGEGPYRLPLVAGRSAAGAPFAGRVPPGQAIRVLTGAALPEGVDTVVLQEDTTTDGRSVAFRGPLKPGANTRRAGEDVASGAEVLAAGHRLTPADIALVAAVGHGTVTVRRRLRVAVLSTGDELREPGAAAGPGQIWDANRPMLSALLEAWGCDVVDIGRIADDRAVLRAAFDRAVHSADAILTSGGASAGDEDHVSALLRETGSMSTWRVALKPGRPLALGLWQGRPVFGLPGNPVATLVCALVFARPALGLLAGADWQEPQGFDVPAAFEKRKKAGRREYLRARIRDGRVEVFASEGSGRIAGLSWAEGLVELPDAALHVRPGDPVRYIPFSSFGL